MKKLVDLYFNYDVKSGEYVVNSQSNMEEKNRDLVEDLMHNAKVRVGINNACKNINTVERKEENVKISTFDVNLSSTVSTASTVKVEVTLLKAEDESDLMISLFSMVNVPSI